jgi:uncharacterized protein (DUF2141 family)
LALALSALTLSVTVTANSAPPAPAQPAPSKPTPVPGRVTVQIVGVANAEGQLLIALYRSPAGWPGGGAQAYRRKVVKSRTGSVQVVLERVPPGPFAVAVLHDADRDFVMDTGLFGIPKEGYGFSRDASAPFSAPSFDAAKLVLRPSEDKRVRIRLRY